MTTTSNPDDPHHEMAHAATSTAGNQGHRNASGEDATGRNRNTLPNTQIRGPPSTDREKLDGTQVTGVLRVSTPRNPSQQQPAAAAATATARRGAESEPDDDSSSFSSSPGVGVPTGVRDGAAQWDAATRLVHERIRAEEVCARVARALEARAREDRIRESRAQAIRAETIRVEAIRAEVIRAREARALEARAREARAREIRAQQIRARETASRRVDLANRRHHIGQTIGYMTASLRQIQGQLDLHSACLADLVEQYEGLLGRQDNLGGEEEGGEGRYGVDNYDEDTWVWEN